MKIGVAGWFGYDNPGDDLILNNFLKTFKRNNVVVFTTSVRSAEAVKQKFGLETYTPKDIPIVDIDALIFGGGGVLTDMFIEANFPKKLIKKVKCPVLLIGVGIPSGEGITLVSHKIDYFINKVCFFGFRDFVTKYIFNSLWDKPAFIFPDLGFLTQKVDVNKTDTFLLQHKLGVSYEFRNLTPANYSELSTDQFVLLFKELKRKKLNPKFLKWQDFDKVTSEIAKAKWIITTSLHAGIIAITQSTPFIALHYINKVSDVLSLVVDQNRLVYPDKIYDVNKFVPLNYSKIELEKLFKLKCYLEESLLLLQKSLQKNRLEGFVLKEFPFAPPFIHKSFLYGGPKPRFIRKMINRIKLFSS